MSGLFGAHGFATTLTEDARRGLLARMGDRASTTLVAQSGIPAIATAHADGVALGLYEGRCGDEVQPPHIERADHLWLAFAGRLDHRDALDRKLGLAAARSSVEPGRTGAGATDAAVVMAAYRRYGIGCVNQLAGDWSFALWDDRERRLILARDATGISSLFWWAGGGLLLFASSLPALLSAGPVPTRPDPRWIAGLLTVFIDSAHPGSTALQDVHALPPGHLLIAANGRFDLDRWWHPESLQPFYGDRLPELQERFLTYYGEAVRALLRNSRNVTATLSGGLDSGSVVALAAPALAKRDQRLTAYVHRPRFDAASDYPTRATDEWELAQATARHVGNVDTVACPSEHLSPLDGIRHWLDMAVVPSHGAPNWFWILDIAKTAASAGADVLLVGQAGNSTVSYPGNGNLWPRVLRLQWSTAYRELRADKAGPFEAFKTRLAKPALRPAWHGLKRAFAGRPAEPPWQRYSLVHPALAQEMDLLAAMRADGHDPTFAGMPPAKRDLFRLTLLGGVENGASAWTELGRSHGFDVRDPTRDRRLVELCWRLPDELFWAQGWQRGLVRHAMRDALPAKVLASGQRGLQSADLRQRLQAGRAEFLAEVERLCRHPTVRQWIDVERLSQSAQATFDPAAVTAMSDPYWPQHLLRTLAAAEFVARHT